jgi:Domain of Unknown Function (DUF748)
VSRSKSPYLLAALAIIIAAAVIVSIALDPFVRARVEQTMNRSLKGYHTSLGHAHVSLLGGALALSDLTIIQDAHPSPPVGHIPYLRISIEWHELLGWHVVADCLINQPALHINLIQLSSEAKSKVSLRQRGWQDALQNIYPFKINRFRVRDGAVTYIDTDPNRPLDLEHLNITAGNIRNIDLPNDPYPSTITADTMVFETGHASIDGRANFLSKPVPGLRINYQLEHVPLAALEPAIKRVNLTLTGGRFASDGMVEYSPTVQRVEVRHAAADGVDIEYVHETATANAEARRVEEVKQAAVRANNAPNLVLKIDQLQLTNGTVAYRDDAGANPYRIYMTDLDVRVSDLSNQSAEGTSALKLNGLFMGSGKTNLIGNFRPRPHNPPDFDINLVIDNTRLPSLNDLLRRYGRFDVQSGSMSVYSQVTVRNNQITGYVKPLFTNIQVYSYNKDKGKPVLHQAYELIVGGAAHLLRNHSTQAVATKVDLSGKFQQPDVSTWQAFVELVQNAFIQAIVPGLDHQEKIAAGQAS